MTSIGFPPAVPRRPAQHPRLFTEQHLVANLWDEQDDQGQLRPAQTMGAQNDQRHAAYSLVKPPTSGPSSGLFTVRPFASKTPA